ncbi:hypothetical protein L0V05_01890 [Tabrizicola sp. J26]|nr:hypothetical protein [Tabrizicola rongguiensis]
MGDLKNNTANQISVASRGGRRPGAGRPKGKESEAKKEIAELARNFAEDALKVLVDVAKDANAPAAARVSAANAIIDRGYGKAPATLEPSVNPLAEAIREISQRGSAMPIRSVQELPSASLAALPDSHLNDEDDIEP